MHESERHRLILSAVQDRPVVTVPDLVNLTGVSAATIRRDIAALHMQKKLRRVHGGAEAISPPQPSDSAAIAYFSRPGNSWPDVVFVYDGPITEDGGYIEHARRDPLLTQVLARYKLAETVGGYSVFVRK